VGGWLPCKPNNVIAIHNSCMQATLINHGNYRVGIKAHLKKLPAEKHLRLNKLHQRKAEPQTILYYLPSQVRKQLIS